MGQPISNFLSSDSRDLYGKMRRLQCERLCEAWGIPYPANAPKDDIVAILKGNGIDPLKKPPHGEGVKFVEIKVEDENGRLVTMLYPEEKQHYTADKEIDYDVELEKRVKANQSAMDEKDDRIAKLEAMVAQLMRNVTEESEVNSIEEPTNEGLVKSYADMDENWLREECKAKGIKVHHRAGKAKLIEALQNG